MKIAKRILSLLIVASMLLSCMSFVLADETSQEVCGEKELGLINALEIGDYKTEDLSKTVTRSEFYKLLCTMQGLPETKGSSNPFADVDASHKYAGYIRTLSKLGVISSKDGNIYPDAVINSREAVKLIVNALGYGPKAEVQGYDNVAVKLDLFEGMAHSLSGELKLGDAVVLVYNALRADLMIETVKPSSSKKEYTVEEGTNLLSAAFGVYIAEGVVEGVDLTRVQGENDVRPYHIEIDGLSLNIGLTGNPYEYLGYEVEAYWKDIRNFEPTLVYMQKTDANEEIIIDVDDIASIEGNKLEAYAENGKTKSYKLKTAIPVVYNGASTGAAFTEELIEGKYGSVKLLDNNGNSTYDIAFVDLYENYVVSYVDTENMVIYDKYSTSKSICLDDTLDDPYVVVYDGSGKSVSIANAVKNSVVSVYKSQGDAYQTYIEAYISNTVVSGEIESTELSENIITVEGTEYELSDSVIARFGSFLVPGTSVSMAIDVNGKVASVEANAMASYKLGYLLGADTDGALEKTITFKLYTAEGEFAEMKGASNIYIDGNKYKNTDEAIMTDLHDVSVLMFGEDTLETSRATVVRYSVNGAGELYSIDTPVNGKTEKLAVRADTLTDKDALFGIKADGTTATDKRYRRAGNHNTIGPKIAFTSASVCISVPSGANADYLKEDLYEAASATSILVHNTIYNNVWAFYTDNQKAASDFVVLFDNNAAGEPQESTKFSIVEQISQVMDEDGVQKDAVTILTDAGVKKLVAKDNCKVVAEANEKDPSIVEGMKVNDLKKGDIILYSQNPKGELTSITLWYRTETHTTAHALSAGRWDARSARIGYVYKMFEDGYLMYFTDNVANLENITAEDCEYVINTGATPTYFMYKREDDGKHRIDLSDVAAIKSYEDTGSDASKIFLHSNYGRPYTVVIFE